MGATEIEKNVALLEHEDETMWAQILEKLCSTREQYEGCFREYKFLMEIYHAVPILPRQPAMLMCWAVAKLTTEAVRRGLIGPQDPTLIKGDPNGPNQTK